MQNFQDTFETRKGSFISAFSICITVPLTNFNDTTYVHKIKQGKICSQGQQSKISEGKSYYVTTEY